MTLVHELDHVFDEELRLLNEEICVRLEAGARASAAAAMQRGSNSFNGNGSSSSSCNE